MAKRKILKRCIFSVNIKAGGISREDLTTRLVNARHIKDWIFILHDRDINALDEDVPAHYYVAIRLDGAYPPTSVANWLQCDVTAVQKSVSSVAGHSLHNEQIAKTWQFPLMLAYATHGNDRAKTPYDDSEVVASPGFGWQGCRKAVDIYVEKLSAKKDTILEDLRAGKTTLGEVLEHQRAGWIKSNARNLMPYTDDLPVLYVTGSNATEPILPGSNIKAIDSLYSLSGVLRQTDRSLKLADQIDDAKTAVFHAQDKEAKEQAHSVLVGLEVERTALFDGQGVSVTRIQAAQKATLDRLHDLSTEAATRGFAHRLAEQVGTTYVVNQPEDFGSYNLEPVLLVNLDQLWMTKADIDALCQRVYRGRAFPWLKLVVFYTSCAMSWSLLNATLRLTKLTTKTIKRTEFASFLKPDFKVVEVWLHPIINDDSGSPTVKNTNWFAGLEPLDDDASESLRSLYQSLEPLTDSASFNDEVWEQLGVTTTPACVAYLKHLGDQELSFKNFREISDSANKSTGEGSVTAISAFLHSLVGGIEIGDDDFEEDVEDEESIFEKLSSEDKPVSMAEVQDKKAEQAKPSEVEDPPIVKFNRLLAEFNDEALKLDGLQLDDDMFSSIVAVMNETVLSIWTVFRGNPTIGFMSYGDLPRETVCDRLQRGTDNPMAHQEVESTVRTLIAQAKVYHLAEEDGRSKYLLDRYGYQMSDDYWQGELWLDFKVLDLTHRGTTHDDKLAEIQRRKAQGHDIEKWLGETYEELRDRLALQKNTASEVSQPVVTDASSTKDEVFASAVHEDPVDKIISSAAKKLHAPIDTNGVDELKQTYQSQMDLDTKIDRLRRTGLTHNQLSDETDDPLEKKKLKVVYLVSRDLVKLLQDESEH
ncbi:Rep family protein [Lacticaseibacillus jixiensis]|uniref:Rep family protein n=1 Tax=Lacticaseibacillus jixiensis TaxID=3231926 RepID=UPI0036F309C2